MEKHVMLPRDREPVAEPRPVRHGRRLRDLPELLASLPHLSPEGLASFEADLEAARTEFGRFPIQTPWES
jgi:hypothetical protein